MITVNPNNGNETKSDIFSWDISSLILFSTVHKMLKYLNDFYN